MLGILFFCGMVFVTYTEGYCVFSELDNVSELIAFAALVVEAGVVVVTEFADFVEDCEVA